MLGLSYSDADSVESVLEQRSKQGDQCTFSVFGPQEEGNKGVGIYEYLESLPIVSFQLTLCWG